MESARKVTDEISILPSFFPIPGFGLVPVNAYVIKAAQPVLVDTGLGLESDQFLDNLRSVIEPQDLRWLWLSHPDADHIGSLKAIMDEVPHLRLVTSFFGYGILSLFQQIPMDRIYLINPGESLEVGDRHLTAYRPPTFDNPTTTGFYDSKSRVLFSSDCFGALVDEPVEAAEDLAPEALRRGQTLWTTIDSAWLHNVDERKFAAELNQVRSMEPSWVLSSHLPPSRSLTGTLLDTLATVPGAEPFVGPNQVALEAMLASMTQPV